MNESIKYYQEYLKFKESDKRIAELINQLCEFE